jgi:hypothetical protein
MSGASRSPATKSRILSTPIFHELIHPIVTLRQRCESEWGRGCSGARILIADID